jgi:hypothetical protein
MKRRFPGYLVRVSWFGEDDGRERWEPSLRAAYKRAGYLVRLHRHREEPRFWVNVGVLNLRTGRYETCC